MNFSKSFFVLVLFSQLHFLRGETKTNPITREVLIEAEKIIGLNFSDEKRDLMLEGLNGRLSAYESIRKQEIPYATPPAVLFNPIPVGFKFETEFKKPITNQIPGFDTQR